MQVRRGTPLAFPTQPNHPTVLTQLSLSPPVSVSLHLFIQTRTPRVSLTLAHTSPNIAVALAAVVPVQAGADPRSGLGRSRCSAVNRDS